MKTVRLILPLLVLLPGAANAQPAPPPPATSSGLDTALIERLTGAKGALDAAEGVFKVSVPRTDLGLEVAGVRMTPRLGLTSWAAFRKMGDHADHAMVMGDLVLREDQVNPVMSAALAAGLEVTALHNHFLWDTPRVMFMHIGGHGPQDRLATAVGVVFRTMQEKPAPPAKAAIDPAQTTLDPKAVESILNLKGDFKDGVLRFAVGKPSHMAGETIGNAMGVNTWAAFAGSDAQAVLDGDFAMVAGELQAVLKALRAAGINVVAIHSHMAEEEPRILFLHYWGIGPSAHLARGLKSALEAQAGAGKTSP
ncbi:MAG: DUF1259 domain-containing protein [Thermoanaerobaculia bacterium]